MRYARLLVLVVMIVSLLALIACGGNAKSATATPAPTPGPTTPTATPTPTPTPTPPPTPSPAPSPAPSPGPPQPGSTGTGVFQAFMIQQNGSNTVSGQITVDLQADDGKGVLQLNNAAASSTLSLQFCPFPSPFPDAQQNRCTSITDFNSNPAGQATVNFQFPKDGIWAGIFVVVRNNTVDFASGFNVPGTGQQFKKDLHQASSVTSGTGGMNPGGDALKNGSVTVTDNTARVTVQNATINVTYSVVFCLNGGGSSCFQIGTLTTDQTGSATSDFDLLATLGTSPSQAGIFRLNRSQPLPNGGDAGGVQFMTAFVSGCAQVRCE